MDVITGIALGANAVILLSVLGWILLGAVILSIVVLAIREFRK